MLIGRICLLIVISCFWRSCVQTLTTAAPCYSTDVTDTIVSITSHKNLTGHWISQVGVKHSSDSTASNKWAVDINHKAHRCAEHTDTEIVFTFSSPPPKAGPNYELFPGMGYYKFHTDVTTWKRARDICAEEGGHLVIINSNEEADVVKHLFTRHPKINGTPHNDWAWVGLYKRPAVEGWRTIFGDPLNTTGYVNWFPGQPNDKSDDNYMLAYRLTAGLNDHVDTVNDAFICEQELW